MRTLFIWLFAAFTFVPACGAVAAADLAISKTARCGNSFGLTCKGSAFGDCCSAHGYCGSGKDYCGEGCQPGYGKCLPSSSTASSQATALSVASSTDGSCGGNKRRSCLGSRFGDCCSQYGYCGSSVAYCGAGCQSTFGKCASPASSGSNSKLSTPSSRATAASGSKTSSSTLAAAPSSTLKVTSNARCGSSFGFTCMGSRWGECCSQYSYCGSTSNYCGDGCQSGYGKCNVLASSSGQLGNTVSSSQSQPSTLSTSTKTTSTPSELSTHISTLTSTSFELSSTSGAVFSSGIAISSSTLSALVSSSTILDSSSMASSLSISTGMSLPSAYTTTLSSSTLSTILPSASSSVSSMYSVTTAASLTDSTSIFSGSAPSSISPLSAIDSSSALPSLSAISPSSGFSSSSSIISISPESSLSSTTAPTNVAASSASTVSTSSSCPGPTPTNLYVRNPSFDDPSNPLDQWLAPNGNGFGSNTFTTLTTRQDDPHSSKNYFYASRTGSDSGFFYLRQSPIAIPDGTKVTCNAWVKGNRNGDTKGYTTFTLTLTSLQNSQTFFCSNTVSMRGDVPWTRIGTGLNTITVKGNNHLLKLTVQTNLGDQLGTSVGIDDIFIGLPPTDATSTCPIAT